MASMVEALGMSLPGNAAIPAVDARRSTLAQTTGRRIVEMVREDLRTSKILTRAALENAIFNNAIGGSSNAVIHLLALARRVGVPLSLDDWDRLGSSFPCLVDLQPSGQHLMEDFFYAGGVPVVLRELEEAGVLNREALIWENVARADCWNREVIRTFAQPFKAHAGIAVVARQHCSQWRRHQAVSSERAPFASPGTSGRIRECRGASFAYQ